MKRRPTERLPARAWGTPPAPISPEAADVLRERAESLAAPAEQNLHEVQADLVLFELAGESFAIRTSSVCEVLKLAHICRLPSAPRGVLGLVPWRGEVVVAADLRPLLELPGTGLSEMTYLIVLGGTHDRLGLLVDRVAELGASAAHCFVPGPEGPGLVEGISAGGVQLLDSRRLLGDPRLVAQGDRPS